MTMAATGTLPRAGSELHPRIALYAPHNHLLATLSTVPGLESLTWIDSREVSPQQLLQPGEVQLLLLDYTDGNAGYSQSMAQLISQQSNPPPMLGIGSIAEGPQQNVQLLAAIRAGVRDFIDLGAPTADIQDILRRVRREIRSIQPITIGGLQEKPERSEGKLIVLLGVRPGMGTSTLAAHLGTRLASAGSASGADESHLLLDLGYPVADAALYLGVEGGFHLEDALRSVNRIDATFAASAVSRHGSGLSVLARGSNAFAVDQTALLLQRLLGLYSHVICDLGGNDMGSIPAALLAKAHEIWLVADQSIGALLSLDRCLQTLEQRGQRDERLQLVLNRHDDGFGITSEQVAARFGLPLLCIIPERSRQLRSSASIGRLLHEQHPNDPYLLALQPLLKRVSSTAIADANSVIARLANHMRPSKWMKK